MFFSKYKLSNNKFDPTQVLILLSTLHLVLNGTIIDVILLQY